MQSFKMYHQYCIHIFM